MGRVRRRRRRVCKIWMCRSRPETQGMTRYLERVRGNGPFRLERDTEYDTARR
jgi:hypothetical protein